MVYLTLSALSNAIRKPTRLEFIAHRDFTPLTPGSSDALREYGRRRSVAASDKH